MARSSVLARVPPVSIRRRIPASIALVLAAGVGVFGAVAYRVVHDSAVEAADARLREASRQLAAIVEASLATLLDSVRAAASEPALARALGDPGPATAERAREAMARLGRPTGQLRGVELRDRAGREVLALEGSSPAEPPRGPPEAEAHVSPFFLVGDTVYYEVSAPVITNGAVLGELAMTRSATTTHDAVRRVADLIGVTSGLLLGNADGSLWTDLVERVERPASGEAPIVYERAGKRLRSVAQPIGSSPLQVAVEFREEEVLRRPRDLVRVFAGLALVIVALGALAGWGLSRPLTAPLVQLAAAADAIARGDSDRPHVATDRRDELGVLARSFDAMAENVRAARDSLEQEVAARTAELGRASTRLEEAQEELVRRERLATLGQLSGSVGHELRNPLGVMGNAIYYLEQVQPDAPPKVQEYLALLRRQIRTCEKIVADLLDFARVPTPERARVDLRALVEEQLALVPIPPSVAVGTTFPAGMPAVEVDAIQIGQVILNLLSNALQAMDESGGTLSIDAGCEGGAVLLRITDAGPGVRPEHRAKVFEPLFTTKARGIGLGLAVSRSLARANGGDLVLAESPGWGARFVLTLPAVDRH